MYRGHERAIIGEEPVEDSGTVVMGEASTSLLWQWVWGGGQPL